MKYIFLPAALLLVAAGGRAQTAAGGLLLSGSVGYINTKGETTAPASAALNQTTQNQRFNFSPRVGYFLSDKLTVGLLLDLSRTKLQEPDFYPSGQPVTRVTNDHLTQVGPFVRYYYAVSDKAAFYGQLAGGYAKLKEEVSYEAGGANQTTYEPKGGFADLMPGFVFFPTSKLGLELTLGSLSYNYLVGTLANANAPGINPELKVSSWEARFGLTQLMLGASFYLGGSGSK
ncbi:outer membrane beta-barrel protein [Hymenobacter sp. 15J16-1T3B]|uniref:outer membrane beta-barrel protein n=1 Tax=Hymenobacter sp. 15J16-1T3B TaxID=2886941 RepID=UPI001D102B65|nr:outer membrane beta-barrel protein [Hymenobacter sp. 15J16-1T3B]MCC3156012.1 outer membrane beta-barrel protein [Hymenobacter sp. 15J16-1T3B]